MNSLRLAIDEYIALRRSLGFKLEGVGFALHSFVAFAEREGAEFVTSKLALRWATAPTQAQPHRWTVRLGTVRRFARQHQAVDPRTEIPPDGLLPYSYRRRTPYIYSDDDVQRLLAAATALSSPHGLRGRTYTTLFGLLAVSGLRLGEALGLDHEDVDLRTGVLTIRRAKFGKTRYVPIHRTTCNALGRYARDRERIFPAIQTPAWFVSEQRTRITKGAAENTFRLLVHNVGLRGLIDRSGPRIHDFRHGFAVRTLLSWYRAGLDVERKMDHLATYLGHVEIRDTYWYISATPELLHLAARRVDTPLITEVENDLSILPSLA